MNALAIAVWMLSRGPARPGAHLHRLAAGGEGAGDVVQDRTQVTAAVALRLPLCRQCANKT